MEWRGVRDTFSRISNLLLIWVGIAIGFGVIFFLIQGSLINSRTGEVVTNLGEAVYFSFISISTIGYGDIYPLGFARFLTAFEGLLGWILFGIIVYRVVSVKQDFILKEIHNLSNDQYLNRIRNSLFISNTNIVRFIKDVNSKKISKSSSGYELSIISTTLSSNIDDAKRFLCKSKSAIFGETREEEVFLLVKIINLCIANMINSINALPKDAFEKNPLLYDNVLKIVESGKGIYNYVNIRVESKRIDELKRLYTQLEDFVGKFL